MSHLMRPVSWVLLGRLLLGSLLFPSPCALALSSALDVSQYGHTAWRIRDGFTRGTVETLAQTHDGVLWLGTSFGLLRFDGVRTTPLRPAPDESLPDIRIRTLLV